MQSLPEPLRPLASYSQFIVWEAVWDAAKGKYDKLPRDPVTGGNTDHLHPAAWMPFHTAQQIALHRGWGVGFILTDKDPFFCVDIDSALTPSGWSPVAQELCAAFHGAAIEVSHSGKGVHIFGTGQWPPDHRCKNVQAGIEFYTTGRFIALTGTNAVGNALTDCTQTTYWFLNKYLPPRVSHGSENWTTEPDPEWSGPDNDDELIKKMLKSKSSAAASFGSRAPLKALWECDEVELARCYPSQSGDVFDRSSADAALLQHLAFWTGKNCERMERLFARSGLIRGKWIDREDYRYDSITRSVAWCSGVYKAKQHKEPQQPAPYVVTAEVDESTFRHGYQFLGLPQQIEHFKGCVYVTKQHAVWSPTAGFLKAEQFRAMYGGYWFALDSLGDKTTKNAWEAFTESQGLFNPRAVLPCFRPELGTGTIIDEEGVTKVNTYVPIDVKRLQGDPAPFLDHVRRLLPLDSDREILISYMAACVQHQGEKFRWAPLIQGVEGNGKTILSLAVASAIGRRYSHSPKAAQIANNFNFWIENKLFIYVEDIYTPVDKQEILEALKVMITGTFLEIEPKGRDTYMADNRANFILNSNHQDGVRKTRNDRRIAPFFTAQQEVEDLTRDGMTEDYFSCLDHWLKNGGYAVVSEFLHTYQIPAHLNPVHHARAPRTSSTDAAIFAGMGGVEQEIAEVIAQGRPGFAGGWVSSVALDRLLEQRRDARRIPTNKRKDLMHSLGYIYHPHLQDGRASMPIAIDGGSKPRLYIRKDHLACQITQPNAIVDTYVKAQEVGGVNAVAVGVFGGYGS